MNTTSLSRRAFVAASVHSTAALALSSWASAASSGVMRLPVKQARALVVDENGLITVAADRKLLFIGADGQTQSSIDTPRPVRALSHDAQGRLWMTFSDQVAHMPPDGSLEMIGGSLGKESALTGIALAEDGRIFAADSAQRLIWRLDAKGAVLGQIKPGEKGFAVPRAFFPIAWQDGHLIVAEPGRHQIQRFTAEGEKVASWGARSREEAGFAGCCNPVALAPQADGSIVTVERGSVRVKRFDTAGKVLAQLAGPDAFAAQASQADDSDLFACESGLLDVAVSKAGRVIVLDRTAGELHVLS